MHCKQFNLTPETSSETSDRGTVQTCQEMLKIKQIWTFVKYHKKNNLSHIQWMCVWSVSLQLNRCTIVL